MPCGRVRAADRSRRSPSLGRASFGRRLTFSSFWFWPPVSVGGAPRKAFFPIRCCFSANRHFKRLRRADDARGAVQYQTVGGMLFGPRRRQTGFGTVYLPARFAKRALPDGSNRVHAGWVWSVRLFFVEGLIFSFKPSRSRWAWLPRTTGRGPDQGPQTSLTTTASASSCWLH